MTPQTLAGRAIVWRLEEAAAYWDDQSDRDELHTHERALDRAWRDACREALSWLPEAVARAEDEAAESAEVVA